MLAAKHAGAAKRVSSLPQAAIIAVATIVLAAVAAVPMAHAGVLDDAARALGIDAQANGNVQGLTPTGTTVDMFDYWVTSENEGTAAGIGDLHSGINAQSEYFKFIGKSWGTEGANQNTASLNAWTGSHQGPFSGIVERSLDSDGYPVLASGNYYAGLSENSSSADSTRTDTSKATSTQSLGYLFNQSDFAGKRTYANAQGLFQLDANGNYVFDSQQTYAELTSDNGQNVFSLNEPWHVSSDGSVADQVNGQFFPFNSYASTSQDTKSSSTALNHFFGMHMSSDFIQPTGGTAANGQAMEFGFSGDDDVWIFIDGVLVGDAGGVHDRVTVDINFATGAVRIGDGNTSGTQWRGTTTTIKQQFEAAGKAGDYTWRGNTFADNTSHTIDFFYLERGAGNSNAKLTTNLVSAPDTEIAKINQNGAAVQGAQMALYPADENYNVTGDAVAHGTTDATGALTLVDGSDHKITWSQLYSQHQTENWVMREESAPAGYRVASDMKLRYVPKTGIVYCTNEFESGTFASARETITSKAGEITDAQGNRVTFDGTGKPESGCLFVVPLKYVGTGDASTDQSAANWRALSGTVVEGWELSDTTTENYAAIIEAAQAGGSAATQFASTSGGYQAVIDELPGSIDEYYWAIRSAGDDTSEARYALGVYYTSASSMAGATANNTVRLSDETANGFTRQFAARFYITDTTNRLLVQKWDSASGHALEGAAFSLYSADDTEVVNGKRQVKEGAQPAKDYKGNPLIGVTSNLHKGTDDSLVTYDGSYLFEGLMVGDYYLKEVVAPEGYQVNDELTHIKVISNRVFVNAGVADDGIEVIRGVGTLVQALKQFGGTDAAGKPTGVDATLHNVIGTTSTSTSEDPTKATDWKEHCSFPYEYNPGEANIEYTMIGSSDENQQSRWVDEGWAKFDITQDLDNLQSYLASSGDKASLASYDDLGDTIINNSFARSLTVRVDNQRTADLELVKAVSGYDGMSADDLNALKANKDFTFTVGLTTEAKSSILFFDTTSDEALTGTYDVVDDTDTVVARYVDGTFYRVDDSGQTTSDEFTFTLKDASSYVIKGLPVGTKHTITEADPGAGWNTTGDDGTSVPNTTITTVTSGIDSQRTQITGDKQEQSGERVTSGTIQLADGTVAGTDRVTVSYDNAFTGALVVKSVTMTQVTDDNLDQTGTAVADNTAAFVNTYNKDAAEFTINGTKRLIDEGLIDDPNTAVDERVQTPANGAYSFELRPVRGEVTDDPQQTIDAAAVPMPAGTVDAGTAQAVYTATNEGQSVAFGRISFTDADAGKTYTYRVTEVVPNVGDPGYVPGVQYDDAEHTVEVAVSKDGATGALKVVATYPDQGGSATFTNTYAPTGATAALHGTKTLVGRDMKAGESFSFTLAPDVATQQAIDAGYVTVPSTEQSVSGGSDGEAEGFSFGDFTFTKQGTYTFTIKETAADVDGLTFDPSTWTATVTVTNARDDAGAATGALEAQVAYTRTGANLPALPSGWSNDDGAAFTNAYAATGTYVLAGTKTITGRDFQGATDAKDADSFTFALKATGDNAAEAPMPTNPTLTITPTSGTSAPVNFGTFNLTSTGTWTYELSEVSATPGSDKGLAKDDTVYEMTLTVTDDDHDGELTPVASFAKQGEPGTVDALVWNNVYTTTGTLDGAANLTGTKALAGRDWKDGESFTFALAGADARTSAALGSGEVSFAGQPEHTTSVTTTAANPTDGTAHFAFGDLVFTKATAAGDPYRFVIAEVPNDEATNPAVGAGQTRYADATDDEKSLPGWTYEGISYDAQRYTVNVRVVDNGDGTLTATAASTGGSSAFTNAYTSEQPYSGAVDLSVVKTLTGHDLAAGQFTFVVAPGSDKAAQKIGLADASATMTFANDQAAASGAPSPVALPDALKNLTFDQDDSGETFTYTVSEQNAGQTLGGYTYDDASYTVAITPTDNGDGTLSIETVVTDASGAQTTHAWTTGQDPAAVTLAFANSYAGSGELVADVADGSGATKKTYTFTWQVAETTASTEAMAASPAVYDLTVTVTDNDDGTLGVAVAYPQGADEALPFVNVEPKKTVSGTEADGSAVVGKELTYTIAYTNNETTPATVTVTDAIPDNTQIVSAAGEGATVTYTVDGQEVATLPADLSTVEGATWTVANVQPGASGTVTLTVTVLPSAVSTSVTNQATVKIGDHDPGVKTNTVPTEVKGGALVVSKTVVGGDPEQLFDFGITLTDAQGAPLSGTYSDVTFADGAATVRLKGGESKRIEGLPAGASYHVTETPAAGYTADHTSQTGSIPAGGEATAAFTNTYNAEVDYGALGGLALTKTLEGHEVHDGQFSFVVAATDAQADPLGMGVDGTTFTTEAAADGATQTIDVLSGKQVTFTQDDAGKTYVYTVQEKGADGAGYDMDTDVRTVSIHVTDNKNGTMTVTTTVTGGPEGEKTHAYTTGQTPDETAVVPFVNTYAPSDASVALSTTKALTGRDLTAGEFSFELVPGGGDTAVATATNAADGTVDFGTLTYGLADLAQAVEDGYAAKTVDAASGNATWTLSYEAREVADDLPAGVSATAPSFNLTVTVVDDGAAAAGCGLRECVQHRRPGVDAACRHEGARA